MGFSLTGAIKSAASYVGDKVGDAEDAIDDAKGWVGGKIDDAVEGAEHGLDSARKDIRDFGEHHGGIVGKALGNLVSDSIGVTEGAGLAVYDMGKGVVQLADGAGKLLNPVEWATHGSENLQRLEHTGLALKTLSDLGNPVAWATNPGGNIDTAKALWNGVTGGYQDAAKQGDWSKFVGRGVVDIGSLLIGAGEANAAIKGAEGASAVAKISEVGEAAEGAGVVGKAGDATRGLDGSASAGKAGEGAEAASTISKISETIGTNKVTWDVDANGVAHDVQFDLSEVYKGVDRSPAEVKAQKEAATRGVNGDQGGHIVDHRFVLDQGSKNLFPQAANFNLSAFKKLGNEWADWIAGNKEIRGEIAFDPPGAARPDHVQVRYEVVDPATGDSVYSNSVLFDNQDGQVFDRVAKADMPDFPN